ncbi:MAG: YSIRK-type signal peptide-containing protein, partial [Streptococcus mitis]|nr:YSIRK-type signal peptide-containing protein [Streptococcus mitis]
MFHKGKHDREKQLRFSIRKVSFGAASVAVAALFMFLGNGAVSAAEQSVPSTNGETQASQPKEPNAQNGTYEGNTVATSPAATVATNTQPSTVENSPSPESAPQKVETLDKKELTDLIKEIDGKFAKGTYATKTEESVNNLRAVLEEARTDLSTATTKTELTAAYRKLITATSKLQTKSEKKKEAPAVDTTNGKDTVGVKATNTEKAADTNSIVNSGSRDERNGKALDNNNPFRTDVDTTDADPSANQVFKAPAENADLETLAKTLRRLPNVVDNNKKIKDMNTLGNEKNVAPGNVIEINEFGGWKAVGENGKFAIAKATDKGVFPVETVNVTGYNAAWIEEQSFDKSSKYMLFLSKVRTKANRTDDSFDGSLYRESGEGGPRGAWVAKGTKGFEGIEKTFKSFTPETGSKVKIKFKTGYTGIVEDNRGAEKSRAKYKVTVLDTTDGKNDEIYTTQFDPGVNIKNDEMTVVAARNGSGGSVKVNGTSEEAKNVALETMSQAKYKSGSGGTFESKDIVLAPGVKTYKVVISSANNLELGMSYQSNFRQYALPVTGIDYSITQETNAVAKDLLQKIYDKLEASKVTDSIGKTQLSIDKYEAKLKEIKELLSKDTLDTTVAYKSILEEVLLQKEELVDKGALSNALEELKRLKNEETPTNKTEASLTAYTTAKNDASSVIPGAEQVVAKENPNKEEVDEALAAVNKKKEAIEAAKAKLVDKADTTALTQAKTALEGLTGEEAPTGKTADSLAAYTAAK